MKKIRLYLETTLFNHYFDFERDSHIDTVRLFEAIGAGVYEGYTSEYTVAELRSCPEPKRSNMLKLIDKHNITVLGYSEEAIRLSNIYVENKIIPEKYRFDGIHIAIASIHDLNYLISCNYQHINKIKTKRMTELINLSEGYNGITICTPMEVLD